MRVGVSVALLVGGVMACGGPDGQEEAGPPADTSADARADGPAAGWERLPDLPLEPRTGALAAWTGEEVLVVGGTRHLCPPDAECELPAVAPFADGAAYDPAAGTWRPVAGSPQGVTGDMPVATVGDAVYVLPGCGQAECGPDSGPLLRYRPADDAWDELPGVPSGNGAQALTAVGDDLVAHRTSDEHGVVPDWRFSVATDTWEELPDDPLPPSYDRQLVADGDDLMLFAKPLGTGSPPGRVAGARLRSADGAWTPLAPAPASGFQAWGVDGLVVLNPHFGAGAGGGLYDPDTDTWSPLPPPPVEDWDGDMAGALGADTATYADNYTEGWVLDLAGGAPGTWREVRRLDDRSGPATTAVGRALFVAAGARWPASAPDGELLTDAWLWTP
ncbi:MAG TPA: hypothetical protein VKA65_06825 [Acidimicrobiales bacterium]|nr:hypothetical protein [Acidimicrobiales bacterium]